MNNFHNRIRQYRIDNRLYQSTAAVIFGVPVKRYQQWEYGYGTPNLDKIIEMAKYYKVTCHEFVFGYIGFKPLRPKSLTKRV